jgi:hypothetical protein
MSRSGLRLTPQGRLLLEADTAAAALDEAVAARVAEAFAGGSGRGLAQLGAGEVGRPLPPAFVWWRAFAGRYVEALCLGGGVQAVTEPDAAERATWALTAPMMTGAEYITADVLLALWRALGEAIGAAVDDAGGDLQSWLKSLNPAWNLVGRVHFNLAENKADPDRPFAFMATYTTRLTAQARAQHVPLGQALAEYAGADNRDKLLSLLAPVQRAAETCAWLGPMIDAGEIFHPLRWRAREAADLLGSAAALEHAGVIVRMPAAWRANRPARPKVTAVVGAKAPSALGLDAMMDFQMAVSLDGEPLSDREIGELLAGGETLVLLRGQWVEIDRERLRAAMERFAAAEALARRDGLTFAEAMRLLSGAGVTQGEDAVDTAQWGQISAGPWLAQTLQALRRPESGGAAAVRPGTGRVPGRRHGPRQDDPDPRPAAGAG